MKYIKVFAEVLASELEGKLTFEEIEALIEIPRFLNQGDLAFPCFQLAKVLRTSPVKIAENISKNLQNKSAEVFEKVENAGGYVNVFLHKSNTTKEVLTEILELKERYGNHETGQDGVVAIDLSSPNIAKPFSMGHLRSTVIGNSLALILEKNYGDVRILEDDEEKVSRLVLVYSVSIVLEEGLRLLGIKAPREM